MFCLYKSIRTYGFFVIKEIIIEQSNILVVNLQTFIFNNIYVLLYTYY